MGASISDVLCIGVLYIGRIFSESPLYRRSPLHWHSPVHELYTDAEALCHVREGEGAVRLEQLRVGLDPHLPHVVPRVGGQVAVALEL